MCLDQMVLISIYTTAYYACPPVAIIPNTGIFITVFRKESGDYFGMLVVAASPLVLIFVRLAIIEIDHTL